MAKLRVCAADNSVATCKIAVGGAAGSGSGAPCTNDWDCGSVSGSCQCADGTPATYSNTNLDVRCIAHWGQGAGFAGWAAAPKPQCLPGWWDNARGAGVPTSDSSKARCVSHDDCYPGRSTEAADPNDSSQSRRATAHTCTCGTDSDGRQVGRVSRAVCGTFAAAGEWQTMAGAAGRTCLDEGKNVFNGAAYRIAPHRQGQSCTESSDCGAVCWNKNDATCSRSSQPGDCVCDCLPSVAHRASWSHTLTCTDSGARACECATWSSSNEFCECPAGTVTRQLVNICIDATDPLPASLKEYTLPATCKSKSAPLASPQATPDPNARAAPTGPPYVGALCMVDCYNVNSCNDFGRSAAEVCDKCGACDSGAV